MNDQQKISRRNYDEAAKLRNRLASETINRANKLARERHHQFVNQRRKQTSQSVTDNRSGGTKFIGAFIAIGILIAVFALFVIIVSGLKSSPFG